MGQYIDQMFVKKAYLYQAIAMHVPALFYIVLVRSVSGKNLKCSESFGNIVE